MRNPVLRSFPPLELVPSLVLLAAWGMVVSLIFSASATTRPGVSPGSGSIEFLASSPSLSATVKVPTVVLDPGHNGANASHPAEVNRSVPNGRDGTKACDTTGTSTDGGFYEHAFNWDVALRVRDALIARGVRVVLTRSDDAGVGPCVNDRAAIANRTGAEAMVSIHADGAVPSGHGFHVAYSNPPSNANQGQPSAALAQTLTRALRGGGFIPADYIGSDGLYPRSDLAGLNLAQIPAALVECANMRNPQEAALVSTPNGRVRYATAIAEGIMDWLISRGRLTKPPVPGGDVAQRPSEPAIEAGN